MKKKKKITGYKTIDTLIKKFKDKTIDNDNKSNNNNKVIILVLIIIMITIVITLNKENVNSL